MANKIGEEPDIRQNYNPRGKEFDVLKHVYKRYYQIKESEERTKQERQWDTWEKQWEAWRPEKKADEWQSNHYVPITTAVVESILSEMIDQTPRPFIMPRSQEDAAKSTVMQHIFNYTWEIADGDLELFDIIKSVLIYGTGIAQEYYWQDRRIIKLATGKNKNGKIKYEDTEVLDYDDCYMENVAIRDIYKDERARDFNRGSYKARDVIRRYVMDIDSFKDFFSGEVWNPFGNADKVVPGGDTEYYEFFKPPTQWDKNKIEILWYWARRPEDMLSVVANDVVIKMGPNPYKHKQLPFAKAVDVKRPNQFYGKGEPEILESIQDEQNTIRRMMLDRNKLDIDKMFAVSTRSNLDERDLIARPHGLIPMENPDDVKPIEYGDIPRSVQLGYDWLQQDTFRVTGIDDRFQSTQTASTATEAAILKEAVLRRIKMKLRILEKGFLVDIGRQRISNIIQFYSQPTLEKIVGEKSSQQFKRRISQARRQDRLLVENGKPFEQKFKDVRIQGKRLDIDEKGQVREQPIDGISFFEARPETFIPSAKGGYDIRFEAGSTMPVSKPLMQTKVTEMFDRLMPLALQGIGGYDPAKISDELLRVNDFDPEQFKKPQEEEEMDEARKGNIVQLAVMENQMLLKGENIPESGTPYSTPPHTEIHIALIRSGRIPMQSDMMKKLMKHILGEMMAQETRREQTPEGEPQLPTVQSPETGTAPKFNQQLKDLQPAKIQGGGEVPQKPQGQNILGRVKNFFGRA